MREAILYLIMTIAVQHKLPYQFVQALALAENPELNPTAVHWNDNGTEDTGIMQLNSAYFSHVDRLDPQQNITAACELILQILEHPEINTWWSVAIAYNCGITRVTNPPEISITHANRVMEIWSNMATGGYVNPMVRRTSNGGYK